MSAGLSVPASVRLQIANEFHAEMISRLMAVVVNKGVLTEKDAYETCFKLGTDISQQISTLLGLRSDDAVSLSRLIDLMHDFLNIRGKSVVSATATETVSHWTGCSLADQLHSAQGGEYYCHLYQQAYKGALTALNPNAKANDLTITRSRGCDYCELRTWIES